MDKAAIASAVLEILDYVGENPHRDGLLDTPMRVAKMYEEIFSGLKTPAPKMTTFPNESSYKDLVIVKDIPFYSMCEHHLVPFFGKAHIGYVPGESIVGLSKFARLVDWYAKRPQVQEKITDQVADHIVEVLKPEAVIVVLEARHMCMEMRGVNKQGSSTVTTAVRGNLSKEEREDFFQKLQM
jgi:GTP cyclohydrolase I